MALKDFKVPLGGLNLGRGLLLRQENALTQADNMEFSAVGAIQSRLGFSRNQSTSTLAANTALGTMYTSSFLNAQMVVCGGNGPWVCNPNYGATGFGLQAAPAAVAASGSYSVSSRFDTACSLRRNVYLCSEVLLDPRTLSRIEFNSSAVVNAAYPAGLPAPFEIIADGSPYNELTQPANSWLADGYGVAYRIVFIRVDAEGNELESAPSQRILVRNVATSGGYAAAASAPNVHWGLSTLNLWPTVAVATALRFKVYRSKAVDLAVSTPDDELQLVYDGTFTAVAYFAGQNFTYVDTVPDEALGLFQGQFLYTNANTGEVGVQGPGIQNANAPAPLPRTIAMYQNCMFHGGIKEFAEVDFTLLTTAGLAAGTIYLQNSAGTVTLTIANAAKTAENIWTIFVGGTTTFNIEMTARSICSAINAASTNNFVNAFYVSGVSDMPGRIVLQARNRGESFRLCVSAGLVSAFSPSPSQYTTYTTYSPVNNDNKLMFSKQWLPDAVPPIQFLTVGRNDNVVFGLQQLREVLIVFTTQGVFRVSGYGPTSFTIDCLNETFRALGSRSFVSDGEAVYAWGLQGIARITESAVEIISRPIQPLLDKVLFDNFEQTSLSSNSFPYQTLSTSVFAVFDENSSTIQFWYLSTKALSSSLGADKAICYNTTQNAFTTFSLYGAGGNGSGIVRWGGGCMNQQDRKLYFAELYAGGSTSKSVQGQRRTWAATDFYDWSSAGANVALTRTLVFDSFLGDPLSRKNWREFVLYFYTHPYETGLGLPSGSTTLTFLTELLTSGVAATLLAPALNTARIYVPNTSQLGTRMQVTISYTAASFFALEGLGFLYDDSGSVVGD